MIKISLLIFTFFFLGVINAMQVCQVYDNFSSGNLNTSKWEIRQDVENQPFMEEYWIDNESLNFHTLQNTTGDHRVYLFPKYNFTTGDVLKYDFNVVSKENNYIQIDLLTGDQYIRVGIMGFINTMQGYDELGKSHIKIEFQENNFHLERTSPSNITLIDNLPLTKTNGTYELYIGSVSGHNGRVHIDYDNFELCNQSNENSSSNVGGEGSDFIALTVPDSIAYGNLYSTPGFETTAKQITLTNTGSLAVSVTPVWSSGAEIFQRIKFSDDNSVYGKISGGVGEEDDYSTTITAVLTSSSPLTFSNAVSVWTKIKIAVGDTVAKLKGTQSGTIYFQAMEI